MTAVLSANGLWRWRLDREVQSEGIVFGFFGVNPSTADAEAEDQTTVKWRGFTLRNGGRRYIAANPFAYRATNVRDLATFGDPVGPDNAIYLAQVIQEVDVLVPCWGSRTKLPRSLRPALDCLADQLFASGKPVKIFGLTVSGDPKHPLMLGYDTPLIDWTRSTQG